MNIHSKAVWMFTRISGHNQVYKELAWGYIDASSLKLCSFSHRRFSFLLQGLPPPQLHKSTQYMHSLSGTGPECLSEWKVVAIAARESVFVWEWHGATESWKNHSSAALYKGLHGHGFATNKQILEHMRLAHRGKGQRWITASKLPVFLLNFLGTMNSWPYITKPTWKMGITHNHRGTLHITSKHGDANQHLLSKHCFSTRSFCRAYRVFVESVPFYGSQFFSALADGNVHISYMCLWIMACNIGMKPDL